MNTLLTRRAFSLGSACFAGIASAAQEPRVIGIVAAPSSLGLRPNTQGKEPGTWRAPAALMDAGLAEAISAQHRVELRHPHYDFNEQRDTRIRNGNSQRAFLTEVAVAVHAEFDAGRFPLVLGGDCSVMLGGLYALRRAGGGGLIHVDGHSDFFHPGNYDSHSRLGTAAGMDLALATGHGPDALAGIDGLKPYVREDDTVVFAYRDFGTPDEVETERFLNAAFERHPIEDVRRNGIAKSMREALLRLERADLRGFWIHVDVDVLDPKLMPAVDSLDPGGLAFEELEDILALALASPRVAGMELDIYDPDLDADGHLAEKLVAMLERALTRAGFPLPLAGA